MNRPVFGIVAGLLFGAIDVALMLPLKFEDRPTAFAAAFASRFAIGVLAATTNLPLPGWARGLIVGLLISIPDAIITKAYAPILATGVLGGALIGWAAEKWTRAH
ncbi:MAG: hypothetical protein WA208_03565 [Thermoanaerobaculia bacterium]